MRSVAIMQPTYLPWVGYLHMMDLSDAFVFLDSVQFNPRSWQQRNRVKGPRGLHWLTVPVASGGTLDRPICGVPIAADQGFPELHLRTLRHLYGKAKHFQPLYGELEELLRMPWANLADLNIELIQRLSAHFGIKTGALRSSELPVEGDRIDRLVNLCRELKAERYLAAPGSREYLEGTDAFARAGIELAYHAYEHPTYRQLHGAFEPFASAIDLLFNEGPASREIMLRGRVPFTP